MEWVTVQEIRYVGAASCGPHLAPMMAALLCLQDADPAITDPDITADISSGFLEVRLTITAQDAVSAMSRSIATLRTALGDNGDWTSAGAIMHVAPASHADSLLIPAA